MALTNNDILKKLRVALKLKNEELGDNDSNSSYLVLYIVVNSM